MNGATAGCAWRRGNQDGQKPPRLDLRPVQDHLFVGNTPQRTLACVRTPGPPMRRLKPPAQQPKLTADPGGEEHPLRACSGRYAPLAKAGTCKKQAIRAVKFGPAAEELAAAGNRHTSRTHYRVAKSW